MPKELFEIKNFGEGIMSNASESDIPPSSAAYSLDVEPIDADGILQGRVDDLEIPEIDSAITDLKDPVYLTPEDVSKRDLVFHDGTDIYVSTDIENTPTTTKVETNISPTSFNAVKNNKEVHVSSGGDSNAVTRWIGYNKIKQFGVGTSGVISENAECSAQDDFPPAYKVVAIDSSFFLIGFEGSRIYKLNHNGEVVAKSKQGDLVATTALCRKNFSANGVGKRLYVYDNRGPGEKYLVTFDTGLKLLSTNRVVMYDWDSAYPQKFGQDSNTISLQIWEDVIDSEIGNSWDFECSDMVMTSHHLVLKERSWNPDSNDDGTIFNLQDKAIKNVSMISNFSGNQLLDDFEDTGDFPEETAFGQKGYYGGLSTRELYLRKITITELELEDGSHLKAIPQAVPKFGGSATDESFDSDNFGHTVCHRGLFMRKANLDSHDGVFGGYKDAPKSNVSNSYFTDIGHLHTNICLGEIEGEEGSHGGDFALYTVPFTYTNSNDSADVDGSSLAGSHFIETESENFNFQTLFFDKSHYGTGEPYTKGVGTGTSTWNRKYSTVCVVYHVEDITQAGGQETWRIHAFELNWDRCVAWTLSSNTTIGDATPGSEEDNSGFGGVWDTASSKWRKYFDSNGDELEDSSGSDFYINPRHCSFRDMINGEYGDDDSFANVVNTQTYTSSAQNITDLPSKDHKKGMWGMSGIDTNLDDGVVAYTGAFQIFDTDPPAANNYNNKDFGDIVSNVERYYYNLMEAPGPSYKAEYNAIYESTSSQQVQEYLTNIITENDDTGDNPVDNIIFDNSSNNASSPIDGISDLCDYFKKYIDRACPVSIPKITGLADVVLFGNRSLAFVVRGAQGTPSSSSSLNNPQVPVFVSSDFLSMDIASDVHTSNANGFPLDIKYFYKYSLVYDGYQESPLSIEQFPSGGLVCEEIAQTGIGKKPSISITLYKDRLTKLNKRISAIRIYRSENGTNDGNDPPALIGTSGDILYRLVKELPLDAEWSLDLALNRNITFVDSLNSPTATYESLTGISEVIEQTMVHRGLSKVLNNQLFIANCHHPEIENSEMYLIKSLPYKYDMFDWVRDFLILPDNPIAMEAFNGRLYLFTKDSTLVIDPNTLYIEDTYEGFGCQNKDAVAVSEYGMCYADRNNIYLHNGRQPVEIGTPILYNLLDGASGYKELYDDAFDIKIEYDSINQSFLIFVTKDRFYSYNLMSKRWDLNSTKTNSSLLSTLYNPEGVIYWVLDTTVKGYKVGAGSARKTWSWVSKKLSFGQQSQKKKFYRIDIPYEGNAPIVTYGYDNGSGESGENDNSTGLRSLKIRDKKRTLQIWVTGLSTTIVDSIGIIIRRMLKLTKAS